MYIDLYKISKDSRVVNKVGGIQPTYTQIPLHPLKEVSSIRPVFEIDFNAARLQCNYLYCDIFDSYYYIIDSKVNTAGRLALSCFIDVRQTFSSAILNAPCTVIRGAQQPTQIVDSKLPIDPAHKKITSVLLPELSDSFGTDKAYSYLLTVVGGEPNITP